jgi:Type II secretion system (T2SS), protein E, N-terminal domain
VKRSIELEELCKDKPAQLDTVLSALIDRTKFAYVPLEYYDTDRQIAPMLPEYLTLGRLFVPFDLVSRTMMVACCNPFDSAGRDAVQQSVDYTISWYLARPLAIVIRLVTALSSFRASWMPRRRCGRRRLEHDRQR